MRCVSWSLPGHSTRATTMNNEDRDLTTPQQPAGIHRRATAAPEPDLLSRG